jgi:hypothetical protein
VSDRFTQPVSDLDLIHRAFTLQDMEKNVLAQKGVGGADYGSAGPPNWDRGAWEAFKAQYGFYPFGGDGNGGFIHPPSYEGAPSWVYELMGLRQPPVSVTMRS